MKDESKIHVKLEYDEAIGGKKELLLIQMNLLKISRAIKIYYSLRKKELQNKLKLSRELKSTNNAVKKIQIALPKIRISQKPEETFSEKKPRKEKPEYDRSIEDQLLDIQAKLNSLGR